LREAGTSLRHQKWIALCWLRGAGPAYETFYFTGANKVSACVQRCSKRAGPVIEENVMLAPQSWHLRIELLERAAGPRGTGTPGLRRTRAAAFFPGSAPPHRCSATVRRRRWARSTPGRPMPRSTPLTLTPRAGHSTPLACPRRRRAPDHTHSPRTAVRCSALRDQAVAHYPRPEPAFSRAPARS